ncbi:MAG: ATP-binding protein [Treponema sp.]|nr:ATP-binding protein [Treponema sp.]
MNGFYQRALKKIDRLTIDQCKDLLAAASTEISILQTMMDSLPLGIVILDKNNVVTRTNKSALRLLPLSHCEGSPLWKLIRDKPVADFFEKILCEKEKTLECEIDIDASGRYQLLSISIYPLVDKKKIIGSLISIEDITGKREKEIRMRRLENLASLTTLAAGVAHEIKNPLGSISIHLQLIQKSLESNVTLDGKTDALINKYFNILNEEVDRLNHIVVDFLFAVRPMALDLREGNLNGIINELAEFIKAELDSENIRLLLELEENPPPVLIDERYMKQALLNLIKNAKSAMPKGGVLTIAVMGSESETRISVCDTGIGISRENLKKIFEPYFTTKDTGTGLGLTLVYKIIKEHQGEISVESRVGEGTNFEIILPVYQKEKRLISFLGEKYEK